MHTTSRSCLPAARYSAGVLFTGYLVALGLLLGTAVTARVQLNRPLGLPR